MNKILDLFRPYISAHKHFDLVPSKYGAIYVYPVDRQETLHDSEVLSSPKGVVEAIAFQMVCDQMAGTPLDRVIPNEEETKAIRLRFLSFIRESDAATEYVSILEDYLSHWE